MNDDFECNSLNIAALPAKCLKPGETPRFTRHRRTIVTSSAFHLSIPTYDPPRKLPKRDSPTSPIRIHNLIQIRLRKHRERVPRHPLPSRTGSPPHEMRHGAKLAPRDELERLAGLECERSFGDVDLDRLVGAGADVEAGLGGRGRDLRKGSVWIIGWGG